VPDLITLKYHNGDQLGRRFKRKISLFDERRIKAIQAAAREMAEDIEIEGRADIAAGGNFRSARWQDGFQVKISYKSRVDINLRVTHSIFYWVVFEEGRVIHGKPLLWIPLSFASDAKGVMARDYPGQLFRVDRPGKAPLLMTNVGAGRAEAKYFGKESVTIPKKWHLRDIVKRTSREMASYYRRAMANGR